QLILSTHSFLILSLLKLSLLFLSTLSLNLTSRRAHRQSSGWMVRRPVQLRRASVARHGIHSGSCELAWQRRGIDFGSCELAWRRHGVDASGSGEQSVQRLS
ncbi:unnamed protein product, partial [Urochloa humidicola]